jgi:alpha-glucoside transport system permease protein
MGVDQHAEQLPGAGAVSTKVEPRQKRFKQVPSILQQGWRAPLMYLLPALIIMGIFIVYPSINTFYTSFRNKDDSGWAATQCAANQPCWGIFENYRYALFSPDMQRVLFNNLIWIITMVTATVLFGLLIATLASHVRYENLAKAIIFLPMAISFVGAGIIWGFMYKYDTDPTKNGLLNAIVIAAGGQPISFLHTPGVNTLAMIVVGVWIWTGFCMTVLAAALRGVPAEILESARTDGANEWTVFWTIIVPYILPTLTVIITTMTINVLKVFDLVYVLGSGDPSVQVIATRMYTAMYTDQRYDRAAAIAIVLVIITVPLMIANVRRFIIEEAAR